MPKKPVPKKQMKKPMVTPMADMTPAMMREMEALMAKGMSKKMAMAAVHKKHAMAKK